MAEIPRVPQVTPPLTVSQPVHRIAGAGDRPQPRKGKERPEEDVLELHDMEPEEETTSLGSNSTLDGDEHLDIAV